MKKNSIASILVILIGALFALALIGCGGVSNSSSSAAASGTTSSSAAASGATSSSVASPEATSSSAQSGSTSNASQENAENEEADDDEEIIDDPNDDGTADDDGSNPEPTVVDEAIQDIAPVTIVDDGTCTIVVNGRGTDVTTDPCYRIAFTNKTDSVLYITAEDDFDVNGTPVTAGIDETAEPGQTIETTLFFPANELGGGLDKLVKVSGVLNVEIDDTFEEVATYPFRMD